MVSSPSSPLSRSPNSKTIVGSSTPGSSGHVAFTTTESNLVNPSGLLLARTVSRPSPASISSLPLGSSTEYTPASREPSTSGPIPFPATQTDITPSDSQGTSSSKLTSSDKLSALPAPASPPVGRNRTPNRVFRQGFDPSGSLPSLESLPPNLTTLHQASMSEGSLSRSKDSPKRVSFDSDRASLPALHNVVRQAFTSRVSRGSDPIFPPSTPHDASEPTASALPRSRKQSIDSPGPASLSPSRAHSPLRFFQWSGLHRAHSREEPFVPVDPFKLRLRMHPRGPGRRPGAASEEAGVASLGPHDDHDQLLDCEYDCHEACCLFLPHPVSCFASGSAPKTDVDAFLANARVFCTDTLPRQVYLYLLLRIPSLYFSRVARLFEDAEVSRPDIQRMIDVCSIPRGPQRRRGGGGNFGGTSDAVGAGGLAYHGNSNVNMNMMNTIPFPEDWNPPEVSPALVRFKHSWEDFIDSVMREWKTLNLVSALLLSAILTMFQIPSAADDPVTRTAAFLSLICALMSLSYGCIYIVRFGTMRSMYKASRWAEEARRTTTAIWWNVWIFLAMPAVWLAWSMLLFITSILSFVWRTGSTGDPPDRSPLPPHAALGPRIAITCVFGLGMVYFAMIVSMLKRYGANLVGEREAGGAGGTMGGLAEGGEEQERGRRRERERERERERGMARERDRDTGRHSSGQTEENRSMKRDHGSLKTLGRDEQPSAVLDRGAVAAGVTGAMAAATAVGVGAGVGDILGLGLVGIHSKEDG